MILLFFVLFCDNASGIINNCNCIYEDEIDLFPNKKIKTINGLSNVVSNNIVDKYCHLIIRSKAEFLEEGT